MSSAWVSSHPYVLRQAHLVCQQSGHGPANLVVGFCFGSGTQQNEEEPAGETTQLLSSPLLTIADKTLVLRGCWR